jgi:hypothetical protein
MNIKELQSEKGQSRAGLLFVTLICTCLIYVAWHVLPFYYYFYELQGLMEAQVRVSSDKTEEEIRQNLMLKIKELEIPVTDEHDILLLRSAKDIYLELDYTEVLWFSFLDKDYKIHEFDFHATAGRDPRGR